MQINCYLDKESSKLSEKLIFSCDKYYLSREDIKSLKNKKILAFVEEETLPEEISCQVLVQFENYNKVKIIFFNYDFISLPEDVIEEPFLNKDLIEWFRAKWYFWIEFMTSLDDDWLEINLNYEK